MTEFMQFPPNFRWGTATAAYQIEGGTREDGRKDSIWDVFARIPGKVANGESGDIAGDHYHRWKEDIALMKSLGYKAYRFSLAWPRILPDGRGHVNQAGIDFYNRLIDELLKADIHPLVTLYHWDLPAALPNGWLNRDTTSAFEEFCAVAAKAFGDRVKEWITINEPFCASFLGYAYGRHAPGVTDISKALLASHHVLLAHGLAVPALRAECPDARIGITLNEGPFYPTSQSVDDLSAARHADGEFNRWFLDPVYGRHYPADMLLDYIKAGLLDSIEPEFIHPGDMEKIAVPTDFLGLNYYTRGVIDTRKPTGNFPNNVIPNQEPTDSHTEMGWEIFPFGMYETICRAYFNYKPREIILTENGASFSDKPDASGAVKDDRRIAYLRSHIQAVGKAIQAGVPVSGYYVWSFMDNFEWAHGYAQRFGLVYVDYKTQQRYVKDSAYWYGQVVRENGIQLD
jgi:beta-glucosidase